MKPSIKKIKETIIKVALKNDINLQSIDSYWILNIVKGAEACDFKTNELFEKFILMALKNIPKQAQLDLPFTIEERLTNEVEKLQYYISKQNYNRAIITNDIILILLQQCQQKEILKER